MIKRVKYTNQFGLLIFGMLVAGIFLLGNPSKAYAASLTVSPLRNEIYASPGQTVNGTLTIKNSGKDKSTVLMSAEVFSTINEDYDYKLDAQNDQTNWVRYNPSKFELEVGKSKEVIYSLAIPANAEPGGHYIALIASVESSPENEGVITIERVASLLYIDLPGEQTKRARLVSLDVPLFSTKTDIKTIFRLQNSGTVHFRSNSIVEVKNIFGKTVHTEPTSKLLLPGTIRRNELSIKLPKLPGVYILNANIGLGDNDSASERKLVIVLPPGLTILIVAVISILIYTLRQKIIHKRQKKPNQSV